ncbi:MAG: hypothetical protein PHP54_00660 [Clostridia bacterium]|nr:hypothetical protein [Clostridia bacterium]
MLKNNKVKRLTDRYDYYSTVRSKVDKIAKSFLKKDDEICRAKLYNLVLNLCNQVVYDYTYVFTKDDFNFVIDNDINIIDLLDNFLEDICKIKKSNVN